MWEIKIQILFLLVENISSKKQVLFLEEVQKLNRENVEKSGHQLTSGCPDLEAGGSPQDQQPDAPASNLLDYLREDEKHKVVEAVSEEGVVAEAAVTEKETKHDVEDVVEEKEKLPEEERGEVTSPDGEAKAPELPAAHEDEKEQTATR